MEMQRKGPEHVILVNELDEEIGTMEKLEAHRSSALHRAFSIFLFDEHDRLLLQRRAMDKYHSGGLWTNTCCSHPRPGEALEEAANRRLMEEMGMKAQLEKRFAFMYKASFSNGLHEHELDHVFFGKSEAIPLPDPTEVSEWCYQGIAELKAAMKARPAEFTAWLHRAMPLVIKELELERA